jgi:hypothetical protein
MQHQSGLRARVVTVFTYRPANLHGEGGEARSKYRQWEHVLLVVEL